MILSSALIFLLLNLMSTNKAKKCVRHHGFKKYGSGHGHGHGHGCNYVANKIYCRKLQINTIDMVIIMVTESPQKH